MENNWNFTNPLEEVYAIRRKISAQFGNDVRRIAEAAKEWRRRDEAAGVKYVRLAATHVAPALGRSSG